MSVGGAGFLALMRRLEAEAPQRPRIGRSAHLAEEIVDLGQDPELAFPETEFRPAEAGPPTPDRLGRLPLRARVLGLFGPFGALPLTTTEEVQRWQQEGQGGFVAFADIFAARFLQLFFRAFADSHAITQAARPVEDRFARYVGAAAGTGSPAFLNHDDVADTARLPLVALYGGRVRSGARLRQMLAHHFRLPVDVEEHVPTWLAFEPDEVHPLGGSGALGQSAYLGSRVASVSDRICVHLTLPDAAACRAFLPGGRDHAMLGQLVFWYLGLTCEVDLALHLPPARIPPLALGRQAALGWLAALPQGAGPDDPPVEVARFRLDLSSPQPRGRA